MTRSTIVAEAFAGAEHYDRHAHVQRRAAKALAKRVAELHIASPHLLEIGCGTGFLTEALRGQGVGGTILATDIAPAMLARCRQRMGAEPAVQFAVLDATQDDPPGAGTFDIVTGSLSVQWLGDLDRAVARMMRWLAPGGHLMFNTLADGTFAEWRDALAEAGAQAGTPPYPTLERIAAIQPDLQAAPPIAETLREDHGSARAFLRSLRAIGAHVPREGHRPVPPRRMRAAMRGFERAGSCASYRLVTCHFRKAVS